MLSLVFEFKTNSKKKYRKIRLCLTANKICFALNFHPNKEEIPDHGISTEKQRLTHQRCDEINELKVHSCSNQETATIIRLTS